MLKCLFWSCLLLVAYSYLLYPVVLAAACRLQRLFHRQRPVEEPADWPAVTMVVAALAVDAIFSALGLVPTGPRPSRADVFGSIQVDYKLFLNVFGVVVFAALFGLTLRGGRRAHQHVHA